MRYHIFQGTWREIIFYLQFSHICKLNTLVMLFPACVRRYYLIYASKSFKKFHFRSQTMLIFSFLIHFDFPYLALRHKGITIAPLLGRWLEANIFWIYSTYKNDQNKYSDKTFNCRNDCFCCTSYWYDYK